jgi:hypothetical protein
MNNAPTSLYPFVHSAEKADVCLDSFTKLGFKTVLFDDLYAGLKLGAAFFILQNIDVPDSQQGHVRQTGS